MKKLKLATRDEFDQEVDMLKKFSHDGHPHLISLLATYEQGGEFYLLFDWAKGNLNAYWQKIHPVPDPNDHETVLWVGEQCKGIAHGISKLHKYKTISRNRLADQNETIFGHHGDIKEGNILWYPASADSDSKPNNGVLKLADFGIAAFSTQHTTSFHGDKRYMTPSYRAPESDQDSQGRSYDIWTLGILYLQFATWMLGGWSLLQEFKQKRLSKDISFMGWPTDTFFEPISTMECHTCVKNGHRIKPVVTDVSAI